MEQWFESSTISLEIKEGFPARRVANCFRDKKKMERSEKGIHMNFLVRCGMKR